MYKISISTSVNGSVEDIWKTLNDFPSYPEWNPFMISIEGDRKVGGRLNILLQPKDSKPFRFRPKVLEFSQNKGIRWIGRVGVGGLFDGEHSLKWVSNGDGSTTFVQEETFKGLLVPLLRKKLELQTKPAFEEMNRALKTRVEKR